MTVTKIKNNQVNTLHLNHKEMVITILNCHISAVYKEKSAFRT